MPSGEAGAIRSPSLRDRIGIGRAALLMRSNDVDERLRGVEQVASLRTPEALALLERVTGRLASGGLDPRLPAEGTARSDPRALLVAVRGLAMWTDQDAARAALAAIVDAPNASLGPPIHPGDSDAFDRPGIPAGGAAADDAVSDSARIGLARSEAAMALARTGNADALGALLAIGRRAGPGQGPALDAIATVPSSGPIILGNIAQETHAVIALAGEMADLRTIDAIAGMVRSSDPAVRAAAITALAVAGDARDVEAARDAATDHEPSVRVAAAEALVRLGAPDAEKVVAALVTDDATALDGLRLIQDVQGEDVTKAAAARAIASADPVIRVASVVALGRQTSPAAVSVLEMLASDPRLGGDAACSLAHSPSPVALGAIEGLARGAASRRLAARAYFVRRYTRGERSGPMDAVIEGLARSTDPSDRVVGAQARFAFGVTTVDDALGDADPRVRRAIAMSALSKWTERARSALLERMTEEPDDPTRVVLAVGLIDGDPLGVVPASTLFARANGARADAPLAARALMRRAGNVPPEWVDALMGSPDVILRAQAARGLGDSRAPDAAARLARAYAWEADAQVRRALIGGLVGRGAQSSAGPPQQALEIAATLDPDPEVRWLAEHDRAYARGVDGSGIPEVAWIRLAPADGAALPTDETAVLVTSDGDTLPVAFDDDGYALVPGVPPGQTWLRLAPRLPTYSARIP
jgi:HEAT repeat protein